MRRQLALEWAFAVGWSIGSTSGKDDAEDALLEVHLRVEASGSCKAEEVFAAWSEATISISVGELFVNSSLNSALMSSM